MYHPPTGKVPLARALSKLGVMSRREAISRILAGEVSVNGRKVLDPGAPVIPERVRLRVGGAPVAQAPPLTIVLHKPRGVVTTRSDPQGRPTVYSLLTELDTYVAPVGRLDAASTGLLLFTNDSRLAAWLLDPANGIPRTYIVTMRGTLEDDEAARAVHGIVCEGERLRATAIDILKRSKRETHVRVRLVEGRNRELRRLFAALGHEVTRLKRISFGGLELESLALGKWRTVSAAELRHAFPDAPLRASK